MELFYYDDKKDMDEASKRHEEILNQSENADEKRALVNNVDVNKRLASAAFGEHGRELKKLKNSAERIRFVLLDAQETQEGDFIQRYIRKLEDVLHLADDLQDRFISEDIQKIAMLNLIPKAVVVKPTYSLRNKSISFLLEFDITRREDDYKEIINLLRQPGGNISSIDIAGMGGKSKTVLAQFVYNDVEMQNLLEKKCGYVYLITLIDVKTIVKKMLESLTDSKIDDKSSIEYIQHKLHENLAGETYLMAFGMLIVKNGLS